MATSLWQRGTRALLTLTLLLGLTGCGMNTIPTLDEQVKASWGQVENQYQRRADLIPNLVATVKGYASLSGTFLVYGGMRLPITTQQAICHVTWMQNHLRDAAMAAQMGQGVAHG